MATAPELKDHLVIDQIPDIFVTGHVHTFGLSKYRGVMLLNSSTWQNQTSFQKKHNFVPEPCKVAVVDLKNFSTQVLNFMDDN